jgi:anti-anti-sigma factor
VYSIMAETSYQHVSLETVDGVLVVTLNEPQLRGDKMADALRQELLAVVGTKSGQRVVISFQKVDYVFSAAFRPFLSLRRRLQDTGGRLVFCNLTPGVSEVFQVVRLISADGTSPAPFDVKPDVSAALAFLQAPPSAD